MSDPIYESATAQADASGTAIARLGPQRAFEKWQVSSISVQATSNINQSTAKVYRGARANSRLVNGTYSGNFDTDPDANILLQSGEYLVIVWEAADVGSICTVTIQGTREGR